MLLHRHAEGSEVAQPHRLHKLEVRAHRRAALRVAEDGALGDLAEQQLDDRTELVHRQPEAEPLGRGCLALRLQQAAVRLRVLELKRLDAPRVVQVAGELGGSRRLGEGGLGEELLGLVEELVVLRPWRIGRGGEGARGRRGEGRTQWAWDEGGTGCGAKWGATRPRRRTPGWMVRARWMAAAPGSCAAAD